MQRSTAAVVPARPGFSLLELTLVIAIMGVLIAVAAVSLAGAGERSKRRATEMTLTTVKNQIESYHLNYSAYPPDLRTLVTAKFLEDGKLRDGWDKPLVYDPRPAGAHKYVLGSAGENGQLGDEDDVDVWRINQESPGSN
ncbi:MAG: type II secretion system protein GspG [Planctomycetota bacterium]|nr:type II secretion system protein GspG [Planctomycetota bacterium]